MRLTLSYKNHSMTYQKKEKSPNQLNKWLPKNIKNIIKSIKLNFLILYPKLLLMIHLTKILSNHHILWEDKLTLPIWKNSIKSFSVIMKVNYSLLLKTIVHKVQIYLVNNK